MFEFLNKKGTENEILRFWGISKNYEIGIMDHIENKPQPPSLFPLIRVTMIRRELLEH